MLDAIKKIDRIIYNSFKYLAISLLCLLFLLMALNVLARFVPVFSMGWFDEIVELCFAWMVFGTAAVIWRNKDHPQIDIVEYMLKGTRYRYALLSVIEVINITFLSVFTYYGISLVEKASAWSPIFRISRKVFYIALPITGAYMTVVSLIFLAVYLKKLLNFQPSQDVTVKEPL